MLAVSIHLWDNSSSYMICFPALQMKASGPALQSDQPCVSPLLPLAGMIFSQLNDAHCQALWGKQWYKPLCTIGWSSFNCVHCCIDKISERTFNVFSFSLWTESSQTRLEVFLCNEGHTKQQGCCQWRANNCNNNTESFVRFESCSASHLFSMLFFSSSQSASFRSPFIRFKKKKINTQKRKNRG